jgi:hypothetical protein
VRTGHVSFADGSLTMIMLNLAKLGCQAARGDTLGHLDGRDQEVII